MAMRASHTSHPHVRRLDSAQRKVRSIIAKNSGYTSAVHQGHRITTFLKHQSRIAVMIMRNVFITVVVLSPLIILFGMILFSGKPKDNDPANNAPKK
jgi:hypothetical protein